jgi:2-beta-glucuronyltransferase
MRITFITGHSAESKRKTGFHFWADILVKRGDQVNWVTTGFSKLTQFKDESRVPAGPYNQWAGSNPRSFVWVPLFHPVNFGPINTFLMPLFDLYPKMMPGAMLREIRNSDVFIIESGAGLMLVPDLAALSPNAKFVYFASDRMETLHAHPAIKTAEREALPFISLVRVISQSRLGDFKDHPNVRYIPQGIDRAAFDRTSGNPYKTGKNIVCAGDMLFDAASVEIMARAFPDWHFHLFGKDAVIKPALANVTAHGERDFESTISYLKHADIGLAPYRATEGGDYFAQSSLKIAQYSYAKLPVLVPDKLRDTPSHLIPYRPGDAESIQQAVETAIAYDRSKIDAGAIPDWNDVIDQILAHAGEQKSEAA